METFITLLQLHKIQFETKALIQCQLCVSKFWLLILAFNNGTMSSYTFNVLKNPDGFQMIL